MYEKEKFNFLFYIENKYIFSNSIFFLISIYLPVSICISNETLKDPYSESFHL